MKNLVYSSTSYMIKMETKIPIEDVIASGSIFLGTF
jgi:hypothetical protein